MVGHVKTFALNPESVEAGTIAILRGADIMDVCTVEHLDPGGSWVVNSSSYSGPMLPDMVLCKLVVMSDDAQYPLKFNQWKKSIKAGEVDNDEVTVQFEVVPAKFVQGHYMQTCSICHASFMAHKRQPICENCCKTNSSAKILVSNKKPKPKPKRPRLVHPAKAKDIAIQAYNKGALNQCNPTELGEWLDKQFE